MSSSLTVPSSDNAGSSDQGGWQLVATRRPRTAEQNARLARKQGQQSAKDTRKGIRASNVAPTYEPTRSRAADESKGPTFPRAHRRDHISSTARTKVVNYNRQSLAHFTDPLRVEATTSIATTYSQDESNETTLALVHWKHAKHVQLKLVRGKGAKARIDTLMCFDGKAWEPFELFLETLETPKGQILRGKYGFEQQEALWAKNGKTFGLLDLPVELRETVFVHLIPRDVYPVSLASGKTTFGHSSESGLSPLQQHRKYDLTHKIVPQLDHALAGTCRQVNSEINHFLEIRTTKCFRSPQDLSNFMKKLGDPDGSNNFSHVELDFSHEDYFYLFEVNVQPLSRVDKRLWQTDAPNVASTLRSLLHIKSITLRFTSPFDAMRYDPWGYKGKFRDNLEWYQDWNGNCDQDGFTMSCQKIIVDWILTYAKEYIEHIPEVNLAGAIKNDTKLKWDTILKDERDKVHHDMTEEKEMISDADGPPWCSCTNDCTHYGSQSIAHFDACPNCDCACKYGNVTAKHRYWMKDLKDCKFDFED